MSSTAESGPDITTRWQRPTLVGGLGAEALAGAADQSSVLPPPQGASDIITSSPAEDASDSRQPEVQPDHSNAAPTQPTQEAEPTTDDEPEREVLVTFDAYRRLLDGRGLSMRDVRPEGYRPVAEATGTYVAGVMRRINQIRVEQSTPQKQVKQIKTLYPGVIRALNNFYRELESRPLDAQARHRQTQRQIHLPLASQHTDKIAELQIIRSLVRQIDEHARVSDEFAGTTDAIDDLRMAYGMVIGQLFRTGNGPRRP